MMNKLHQNCYHFTTRTTLSLSIIAIRTKLYANIFASAYTVELLIYNILMNYIKNMQNIHHSIP